MSSAYLRLLIFLLAILIPAHTSSSPAFLMLYSAYKLNEQGDNIQPWRTPFPIWNQSVVPCPVLTVASWPAYRFLKRQVKCSGIPISFRIFHSLLWSIQSKDWHSQSSRNRCFSGTLFLFTFFQVFWGLMEKLKCIYLRHRSNCQHGKKQESSRKTSVSVLMTMSKPLTVCITINCGRFWKRWEYQTTWPTPWETYMQVTSDS